MLEKRKFVRIPESLKISYYVIPTAAHKGYLTRDISLGGIKFFSHEFIPKGTILKIKITFERMHFSLDALVKVVWLKEDPLSQRYEAGVEFVEIPQEAVRYLIKYIKAFFGIMKLA